MPVIQSRIFITLSFLALLAGVATGISSWQRPSAIPLSCTELCLNSTHPSFVANTPSGYQFTVESEHGLVSEFDLTHTKLMHLLVVRKDLASFQHLHPEFNSVTKEFSLDALTFPSDGEYRLFADFALADGTAITLWEDITVGTTYEPQRLTDEKTTKTFDDYQVTLNSAQALTDEATSLTFTLERNGRPVTDLEEYLGALGHAVIVREDTLDFVHVHPETMTANADGEVTFVAHFSTPGRYKIFAQFQHQQKVLVTDFGLTVNQGAASAAEHSQH